MANISPRVVVVGAVHRVEAKTFAATEFRAAQTVAEVLVLTDGGGLAEVRIDDPQSIKRPEQGDRVAWSCDLSVGKTDKGYVWQRLAFVEAYVPAAAMPLHAVNE